MRKAWGVVVLLMVISAGASAAQIRAGGWVAEREKFITNLMRQMTLEEKLGQLNLIAVSPENRSTINQSVRDGQVGAIFNTVVPKAIRVLQDDAMRSRLKIPLFFAYDVIHGHRTIFPIDLGLASTWDLDAIGHSARIAAREASADGLNLTFAPTVDIARDPRWGRISETFGEDTYLTSRIGEVLVKGFQGDGAQAPDSLMSAVKHFAAYGAIEGGRDYNSVDMSPQRLYQDYLPPYKAAVDAGARAVMISLNALNGVPSTANHWLLQDLLREQWGFKGITISDHGAVNELVRHGVAANPLDASRVAVNAGVEMNMQGEQYTEHLKALLAGGKIVKSVIDEACRDVLRIKWDMGLFADPYKSVGPPSRDPLDVNAEERLHRADARAVAQKSLVLLKNDNQALPLARSGTIAVIGPLAKDSRDMLGNWSAAGVASQAVTLYQGLERAVGDKARLVYARGANIVDDPQVVDYLNLYDKDVVQDSRSPEDMRAEAVAAARQADVVVAVVGESQGMAHEASSRAHLDLPGSQRELLKALKATGKPLVVVLMNGRPLTLEWESQHADALLEAWFPGTEGGNAIADVLFGDYNPSGKLPLTFPRAVGQIPIYYNHLNSGRPFNPEKPDKYTSRYFDMPNGPLYPFGYGLSYTQFALADLKLSDEDIAPGEQQRVTVKVQNRGSRAGATVVQLYIRDLVASVSRPVKELKGFQRVMLQPGETRELSFVLDEDDLKFYNAHLKYDTEPGEFRVMVGLDSQDTLDASFQLH